MKRSLSLSFAFSLLAIQVVLAHDPRTVARDFTHSLAIEGAGKLTISYKSLHYNETAYMAAKTNERTLVNLNRVWKKIGKLDSDFDVVIGGIQIAKGSYDMGIGFDASDNFKLLLVGGGKETAIPLQTALDGPVVGYLSLDTRPSNDTDGFTFEGRYGKIRASAEIKVPYLASHDHKTEK
ncbi:MAG TPA: hypothetical protein VJH03_09420 [Blastocatellia bacterium]|nr:hypothetical protein [Blastocatellia bacterium]